MSGPVGVYGGTFNPIHLGHLRAAQEVTEALDLERMLFVPAAQPPHKDPGDDEIAPARLRLDWVRLAVRDNPRFEVDPLEVERGGASYMVDTLRILRDRLGGEPPVFTVGHDAFVEMGSWRAPREIFGLAHIAVTTRPPAAAAPLAEWLPEVVRGDLETAPDGRSARHLRAGTWVRVVEVTDLDISASTVRRLIREGRSTRYLLPEEVRLAVESSGCYAPPSESRPADPRTGQGSRRPT
jgi:nicotinate-nucleotide adenylyltransferase